MHILVQLNCFSSLNTPYNKRSAPFFGTNSDLNSLCVHDHSFIRGLHGLKKFKTLLQDNTGIPQLVSSLV